MKRRDKVEIYADILKASRRGITKTKIMLRADLNFKQTQKYLDVLTKKDLLTVTRQGRKSLFRISDKGKEYLNEYGKLKEFLSLVEVPIECDL
jgi:predicted transcriptional regulator